jgi:hypothetical protein
VTALARCCPLFAGQVRTQHGPKSSVGGSLPVSPCSWQADPSEMAGVVVLAPLLQDGVQLVGRQLPAAPPHRPEAVAAEDAGPEACELVHRLVAAGSWLGSGWQAARVGFWG